MKRINQLILTSITIVVLSTTSCNKDTLKPHDSVVDTTSVSKAPRPLEIESTVYRWVNNGNGTYILNLNDIVSQLNTANAKSISVFLITNGNALPLDKPITYGNGMLQAKVQAFDASLSYFPFNVSDQPLSLHVTVRIVAS